MIGSPPSRFTLPFLFPNASHLIEGDPNASEDVISTALGTSRVTILEPCNIGDGPDKCPALLIGCEDGTLQVLHRPAAAQDTSPVFIEPAVSRYAKRFSKASQKRSRSSSPTSMLSPTFNVTPKPRVVSGITAERVEAPKNYVDFDDEPDKLKDILKGKNPRERLSVSEKAPEPNVRPTTPSLLDASTIGKRKNAAPRSLLSAANSRAATPPPHLSTPSSPGDCAPPLTNWSTKYHILPSSAGFGHSIKCIKLVLNKRYLVALQESGSIFVYAVEDGSCKTSLRIDEELERSDSKTELQLPRPQDSWIWSKLTVTEVGETSFLVATASNGGDSPALMGDTEEGTSERSRCVLYELLILPSSIALRKIGQWEQEIPGLAYGLHLEISGGVTFFSTSHEGHFMVQDLNLTTSFSGQASLSQGQPESDAKQHGAHLSIPHALKSMMSRSSDHLPSMEKGQPESVKEQSNLLSEPHDIGAVIFDSTLRGLETHRMGDGKLRGIVWNTKEMALFEYSGSAFMNLFRSVAVNVHAAHWLDDETYALCFEDRVEIYRTKLVDADNDDVSDLSQLASHLRVQSERIHLIALGLHEAAKVAHEAVYVSRSLPQESAKEIWSYPISDSLLGEATETPPSLLWRSARPSTRKSVTLCSSLPLDFDTFIFGFSDGHLRRYSLAQLIRKGGKGYLTASSASKTSNSPLGAGVVGLHIVQNPRTREKFIVGGGDDGSIAFWSFNSFELVARWIVFTTPLAQVLQLEPDKTGPLRGCALCVARDGTLAIIVIDGFHFLYLLPGASAPLSRVCLGENNMLLMYRDQRARLWDSQTKELWRSMGQDKAEEMLSQGGWTTLDLKKDACLPKSTWHSIAGSYDGLDAVASLSLDLEQLVIDSNAITKTISTSKDEVQSILSALERLKLILSVLHTPGLNSDIDSICYDKLGATPSSVVPGCLSFKSMVLYNHGQACEAWCVSESLTATRALAIISILRSLSLFEDLTEGANTVIAFYSSSLAGCVGPRFKPPSLELLGKKWFDASNDLRSAIRTLFDAATVSLSDEEAIKITEKWQHHVPTLQPDSEKESLNAALALLICGCVAAEKYSLLAVNALMDISKSISLYLHDEKSIYRALAIDLCSRGFHVWQHYIDAMHILRSLFDLATSTKKDSITVQNVGAQARLSVLLIASNNMAILMSTLCLDILNPPTVEHRRSVLQVLAFLMKKRAHVLQAHLPRLMEAVVKSLDPNSTANRELVFDAATEIISYVVKTYPSVCFDVNTQRLAVGTNEGAVVMYDVKTAIRLYVLEGHKKVITACSFSPDGRRLVTVCLKESSVLVWKVGSSFSSFFHPGAPPRQGRGGSEPFKTLNFNVGQEAEMTTAESLDLVRVEWIADRSVKVKIRQSVLTFST